MHGFLVCEGASGEAEPLKPGAQKMDSSDWWDMLCAPGALTRFLMYETPSAAKLEVAGFSLSLCSFDARQPSEQTQAGMQAASSSHSAPAMPSTGPFSEVLPIMPPAGHVSHAGGRPELAQTFRRRKRLRAAGARTARTDWGAAASEAPLGRMAPLDRDFPVEEHVLVQQWGFSINVRVLPPLWREPASSEPLLQKEVIHDTRPSLYTNPLYTSEETSTSSVSDTGKLPLEKMLIGARRREQCHLFLNLVTYVSHTAHDDCWLNALITLAQSVSWGLVAGGSGNDGGSAPHSELHPRSGRNCRSRCPARVDTAASAGSKRQ